MYIERTFILETARAHAWAFLNDPEAVGGCLPGCHTVAVVGPGKYTATVGAKVGPIKVGFDVQVETKEERAPEYAAYTIRGGDKDGGSKISADCTLALRDIEGKRTEIFYTSNVHIVGKLGKFAGGVMQKFADGINDQFVDALIRRVGEFQVSNVAVEPDGAVRGPGLIELIKKFLGEAVGRLRLMFAGRQ